MLGKTALWWTHWGISPVCETREGKLSDIEMDARNVWHCLLQRVLPDFATYGDIELLQRFLVLGIRKIEIVDIRKLD